MCLYKTCLKFFSNFYQYHMKRKKKKKVIFQYFLSFTDCSTLLVILKISVQNINTPKNIKILLVLIVFFTERKYCSCHFLPTSKIMEVIYLILENLVLIVCLPNKIKILIKCWISLTLKRLVYNKALNTVIEYSNIHKPENTPRLLSTSE